MSALTVSPLGAVYPPRSVWDVAAYDLDEVVDGYLSMEPDDPLPGDNRSPAFRWGCKNRQRDRQIDDDGFDALRREFIRMRRIPQ